MFDQLREAASAWRELLHISEVTGLSVGVIVALVALALYVPTARRLALEAAALVLVGWLTAIYAYRVGRADVEAEWAAARTAAAAAQTARDRNVAAELDAKYQPLIAGLQKRADDNASQVKAYERKIVALMAGRPAGACQLGADALRLRAAHR